MSDGREDRQQPQPGSNNATYTVTIYIAAPGTPIRQNDGNNTTSTPGHLYYGISDGTTSESYGFAPRVTGMTGPGIVTKGDAEKYQNPFFARTFEISKEQYERMKEHGESGVRGNNPHFNLHYNGASNSCVDFVWTGLNQAGINKREWQPPDENNPFGINRERYEGALKPLHNIPEVQNLAPPIAGSPFNTEMRNTMPSRTFLQWVLSESNYPQEFPGRNGANFAVAQAPLGGVNQEVFDRTLDAGQRSGLNDEQSRNLAAHATLAFANDPLIKVPHDIGIYGQQLIITYAPSGLDRDPNHRISVPVAEAIEKAAEPALNQVARLDQQQRQAEQAPSQVALEDTARHGQRSI